MSQRGSKSADFIGEFKRYDYAVNVSPDSLNIPDANLIIDFLSKLNKDNTKLTKLHRPEIINKLNEIKSFMKIIQNDCLNKNLDLLIFEKMPLSLPELRKEYNKIKRDTTELIFKKYDLMVKNYIKGDNNNSNLI
jgi:hypothetical protein